MENDTLSFGHSTASRTYPSRRKSHFGDSLFSNIILRMIHSLLLLLFFYVGLVLYNKWLNLVSLFLFWCWSGAVNRFWGSGWRWWIKDGLSMPVLRRWFWSSPAMLPYWIGPSNRSQLGGILFIYLFMSHLNLVSYYSYKVNFGKNTVRRIGADISFSPMRWDGKPTKYKVNINLMSKVSKGGYAVDLIKCAFYQIKGWCFRYNKITLKKLFPAIIYYIGFGVNTQIGTWEEIFHIRLVH